MLFNFLDSLSLEWLYPIWSFYQFPELGVKGAAIATSIASAFMFCHYLVRYYFLVKNSRLISEKSILNLDLSFKSFSKPLCVSMALTI